MIEFTKEVLRYLQGFRSVVLAQDALKFFLKNIISISLIFIPFNLPSIFSFSICKYIYILSDSNFIATYSPIVLEYAFSPISTGALIYSFAEIINGKNWTYAQCFRAGIVFWPKLFIANIIFKMVITVGFHLFIIPGVILVCILGFYDIFIVIEKNGVILSFKNSASAAKNYLVEIIGSFLLILAPILWLTYWVHGPLSGLLCGSEIASAHTNTIFDILKVVILVLFFRYYCLFKSEKHNNFVRGTA